MALLSQQAWTLGMLTTIPQVGQALLELSPSAPQAELTHPIASALWPYSAALLCSLVLHPSHALQSTALPCISTSALMSCPEALPCGSTLLSLPYDLLPLRVLFSAAYPSFVPDSWHLTLSWGSSREAPCPCPYPGVGHQVDLHDRPK